MSTPQKTSDLHAATQVTLIGAVLDLVLGILKILIGLLSSSFALVTDGIHSLSDLVTDAFVLVIARFSHAAPDRDHPYGHRRFETLGTIALGVVLFAVAGVICFDSVRRMNQVDPLPTPGWTGLLIAALSIAGKEWIYRYTRQVAEQIKSSLLLANAWHSRTDALSSVAVLIGILGAQMGYPGMDLAAAFFVGLMIAKIAWDLIRSSLSELVDTALPEEQVRAIRQHVNTLSGIRGAHELRTRRHGGHILVDLHLQVDERISVSEGHYLSDLIEDSLRQEFPEITDVVVHIDPEPDNVDVPQNLRLPLRQEVKETLMKCWQGILPEGALHRLELHYLNNQIEADVYLEISIINSDLEELLKERSQSVPWLSGLNVYGML